MKHIIKIFTYAFALGLVLVSCKEDDLPDNPEPGLFSDGFFILSEGNFGTGNSSMDFYQRGTGLQADVYAGANGGLSPGDVLQSMTRIGDRYFLVVNNSGKIDVLDPETAKLSGSITGLTSPRYILAAGSNKAYVTDLFSGSIAVVNTATLQVDGQISTGTWTERMVAIDNKIYVALMGRDKIWILDPATDAVLDSLETGREPEGLLTDNEGHLYILSTGGFMESAPELRKVDAATKVLEQQWVLGGVGDYVNDLALSADGQYLYWLGPGGVYRMETSAATAPTTPWIATDASVYAYSLGVDPGSGGEVLLGDAVDFSSQGRVFRYSASGTLLDSFQVGINPGAYYFVP
jgi:YVTN family beta-propeller protein